MQLYIERIGSELADTMAMCGANSLKRNYKGYDMAMKKTTLMTEGNIWKQILFFSIPSDFGKSASAALQYSRFHYCRKFLWEVRRWLQSVPVDR